MDTLEESAMHWDALADEQDRMAVWDASRGHDVASHGHRAETYRKVAKNLRTQAATGEAQCMSCDRALSKCSHGGMAIRS